LDQGREWGLKVCLGVKGEYENERENECEGVKGSRNEGKKAENDKSFN